MLNNQQIINHQPNVQNRKTEKNIQNLEQTFRSFTHIIIIIITYHIRVSTPVRDKWNSSLYNKYYSINKLSSEWAINTCWGTFRRLLWCTLVFGNWRWCFMPQCVRLTCKTLGIANRPMRRDHADLADQSEQTKWIYTTNGAILLAQRNISHRSTISTKNKNVLPFKIKNKTFKHINFSV